MIKRKKHPSPLKWIDVLCKLSRKRWAFALHVKCRNRDSQYILALNQHHQKKEGRSWYVDFVQSIEIAQFEQTLGIERH